MSQARISRNTVVRFDYSLRDPGGELIDSSERDEPLTYLHGHGQIVPGLERALDGRGVGDTFDVVVAAAEGYGVYDPTRMVRVPRSEVPAGVQLAPGQPVQARDERGHVIDFVVAQVGETEVVLDGNHRLAGVDLHFHVDILEVRAATAEELAHGHAHGPGGHH
ncbi:peptidylprolyl isomerase [Myxococcota bacterium]|nr:peptidylprolyl isomerase [Myxococcota bacterium]